MPDEQERPHAQGSAPAEDPRLAELTDQALHLLDELADARIRAASVAEWQARCRELEDRLAETRRHVRATRTARLVASIKPPADVEVLDVCLWAPHETAPPERDRWLLRLKTALAGRPAHLLCRPDQRPAHEVMNAFPQLRLVDSEAPNPAQVWNLGVACGEAPLVLFLQVGALLGKGLSGATLAAALDADVALAQPVLTVQGKSPSLGLEDAGGLRLRAAAVAGELGVVPELELVAPEAFVVQRKSALVVGPFDEDLQTGLAIIEYALRCKTRGRLVVGLPGARVDLPRRPGSGLESATDRLVLLARHRPGEVLRELASEPSVWEQDETKLRSFARAMLARLPDLPASGIPILIEELAGLRRAVLLQAELDALLAPVEQELGLGVGGLAVGQRIERMTGALREALARSRDLAGEDVRRQEAERREQAARAESAANASRARVAEAEMATARSEAAAARLEAERSRAEAERSRADSVAARAEGAAAVSEAEQLRAEADRLAQQLAAGRRSLGELIERADEAAAGAEQRLAELARRCELAERRAAELEGDLRAERAELARRVAELATAAGTPEDRHWPSLIESVARARQVLGERERWIVVLLEELAARRIKLRARRLSPDEERFLAQHAPPRPRP